MSTSVKITVEQFEAMVDRGEFDPHRGKSTSS